MSRDGELGVAQFQGIPPDWQRWGKEGSDVRMMYESGFFIYRDEDATTVAAEEKAASGQAPRRRRNAEAEALMRRKAGTSAQDPRFVLVESFPDSPRHEYSGPIDRALGMDALVMREVEPGVLELSASPSWYRFERARVAVASSSQRMLQAAVGASVAPPAPGSQAAAAAAAAAAVAAAAAAKAKAAAMAEADTRAKALNASKTVQAPSSTSNSSSTTGSEMNPQKSKSFSSSSSLSRLLQDTTFPSESNEKSSELGGGKRGKKRAGLEADELGGGSDNEGGFSDDDAVELAAAYSKTYEDTKLQGEALHMQAILSNEEAFYEDIQREEIERHRAAETMGEGVTGEPAVAAPLVEPAGVGESSAAKRARSESSTALSATPQSLAAAPPSVSAVHSSPALSAAVVAKAAAVNAAVTKAAAVAASGGTVVESNASLLRREIVQLISRQPGGRLDMQDYLKKSRAWARKYSMTTEAVNRELAKVAHSEHNGGNPFLRLRK